MNAIVAANSDWGIGVGGTQLLVIPDDRKHFVEITTDGTVIVGRTTCFDFPDGNPLPGRRNIVLTRDSAYKADGFDVAHSLDELFLLLEGTDPDKIFVIGGEKIYRLLIKYCRRAFVTRIKMAPPSDVYFPNLDTATGWKLTSPGEPRQWDGVKYSYDIYENEYPYSYPM